MPYSDPEKQKLVVRQWYENNKSLTAERAKIARQRKRQWYNEFMQNKSCVKCGESDVACLDWHHTNPTEKEETVSFLMKNRSRQSILEEIDKCICLCSNCHWKLHYYGH